MQRPEGFRCPGSGPASGFPHGKDQKQRRRQRAAERAAITPEKVLSGKAKGKS